MLVEFFKFVNNIVGVFIMEQRLFKKVSVIGLEFYVDYLASGEIICIKEVHSGRRFLPDDLNYRGEPVTNLFLKAIGMPVVVVDATETKVEEVKEVKSNAKKAGKRTSK
jgi:hypothetical protein